MACFHPIYAVSFGLKDNGKQSLKILPRRADYSLEYLRDKFGDSLLCLPCGHCHGCAMDYAKAWSVRIMLESRLYDSNCFITLTFDDSNVPDSLEKRPFQLFMKRLRQEVGAVRFFASGELGDKNGRPHYHAILFGYDFPDKVFLKRSNGGQLIYRSPTLEKLWPFGISSIGDVSFQSASYVARYSVKKKLSNKDSGEFVLMSRRPGLAFASFNPELYISDKVYYKGHHKVPRFFDKIAENEDIIEYFYAKEMRLKHSRQRAIGLRLMHFEAEELLNNFNEAVSIYQDALKARFL